jgi:hypothetical protein
MSHASQVRMAVARSQARGRVAIIVAETRESRRASARTHFETLALPLMTCFVISAAPLRPSNRPPQSQTRAT